MTRHESQKCSELTFQKRGSVSKYLTTEEHLQRVWEIICEAL